MQLHSFSSLLGNISVFLFTACLFLHSACTVCNFPSFPPAPCGPWSEWPLIHTDLLEISLNPMCLGRKVSKRSHMYAVPDSWALKEHTGGRSPPPKKPILVPHYIVRGMGGDISWIPLPVALHISTCPCTQPCVSSVAEDPPASVMLWNYIC